MLNYESGTSLEESYSIYSALLLSDRVDFVETVDDLKSEVDIIDISDISS